ncbi:hypothetical protein ACH35V_28080 [Actinomadura sp. 1N219]|uniref:hypothetical protein n=1 Tax=Actinomadura sp. 1N219 TaxID=3375152 RepID=UPI0037A6FB07
MYVADSAPLIDSLRTCAEDGGILSIMTLDTATPAVRPELEHRRDGALAAIAEVELEAGRRDSLPPPQPRLPPPRPEGVRIAGGAVGVRRQVPSA